MQLTSTPEGRFVNPQYMEGISSFRLRTGTAFRSWRMEPAHASALLLIALALMGWSVAARNTLNAGGVLFALLYPLTAYYIGRLLLAVADVEALVKRSFALLFLLGYLALGLLQFAAHSFLPGSLTLQFGAIFAVALLTQLLLPVQPQAAAKDAWATVYLSGFCLLAATCWARGLFASVHADGAEVVFRNWMDLFIHANFITRLTSEPGLWGIGNAEIAGLPAKFYHYASYLGPATRALFSGESSYDAARSYWVPMGTFLTGLAAYVFVLPWAGRFGGVTSAVVLLTAPDTSCYWPKNGELAYHWLQQVGSAGMYGTSCAALTLALLLQWRRQRSRSALLLALSVAAATLLYKAQIFVVLIPLVGACLSLYLPGASTRRRAVLFLAWLSFCCLGALLVNRLHPQEPPFGLNPPYFEEYNRALGASFPQGICRRLLEGGFAGLGRSRYYAAGLGICAVASFGVWLAVGTYLLMATRYRRQLSVADAPPWLALAIYLVLMAGLNDYALVGHNKWEIIHRPFVWVYFLLCTWSTAWTYRLIIQPRASLLGLSPRFLTVAAMLLAIPLLLLPMRMGRWVQEGKSIWGDSCANLRVPVGFVECARFLAHAGKSTDIIQDSRCDDKLILGGLAEKRSYLARPNDWQRDKSPKVRQEVGTRRGDVRQLLELRSVAELRRTAEATGIRWLVLHPDDDVRWPGSVLQSPVFATNGYRVFDLTALPSALNASAHRIAESE